MSYALHAIIIKKPVPIEEATKIAYEIIKNKKKTYMRETKASYRFRNVSKQKFKPKSFRTKKINKTTSLIYGELLPKYQHLKGSGILDWFKQKGNQASKIIKDTTNNVISSAKSFFSPRLDSFNNKSQKTLTDYGNRKITRLQIYRTPISKTLETAINAISLGYWNQKKEKYGFDKFFHLALIATVQGNKNIIVEKLDVVNISTEYTTSNETETLDIPLENKSFSVYEMLEDTRKRLGDKTFFEYDALNNNCQNFIKQNLISVGLYGKEEEDFLFQDIGEMVKELPSLGKIAKGITNVSAWFNKITGGSNFTTDYNKQPVSILKEFLYELTNDVKDKKLKRQDIIDKLRKLNFDTSKLPKLKTENMLKRYSTKNFTEEEQNKFEEEGYQELDPLKAKKQYVNPKTKELEKTVLQEHQNKFISKWILSNFQGAILFHGVGTGKTLTAVVSSHYYLSLYPKNKVIIISPPALIFNFIQGLQQFGLDIRDKRYSYYTYEKFIKVSNKIVDNKTLLIIDEAHSFRTKIIATETEDDEGKSAVSVSQNRKGYYTLEACKKCHKSLLLTGTPFVNRLYDIENLISMVDKKQPLDENDFSVLTTSMEGMGKDYFKYKISHYENQPGSEFFPSSNMMFVPLVMKDEKTLNKYTEIENRKNPFYLNTRTFSEAVESLKVDFVLDKIKASSGKSIIYTTFVDASLRLYIKALNQNNIKYAIISGSESKSKKEQARDDYNKDNVKVLLITKAGTEGVDTIATENIFIIESQWNEALTNQAIARAIRFKSHYHLPKNQQFVNVYRLLVCKKDDVDLINRINLSIKGKGKDIDYSALLLDIRKKEKINKGKAKSILDESGNLDLKKLRKLKGEDKTEALKDLEFGRYEVENIMSDIFKTQPSVDVKLAIMSLAKEQVIKDFIKVLDKEVPQIESFVSPIEEKVNKAIEQNKPYKDILKIQRDELQNQHNNVVNDLTNSSSALSQKLKKIEDIRAKASEKIKAVKKYQEFFTPTKIVKEMLKNSKKLNRSFEKIICLEPTAGSGNIVKELLLKSSNLHIDMVEIQPKNREMLKELVNIAPDILELKEEGDFLKYVNTTSYDLIVLNPPYHLYKKFNPNLDKDYYDMDFVEKSYRMLKEDGELIALVRKENRMKKEYADWLKTVDHTIEDLDNQKWKASEEKGELSSIASINLSIITIHGNQSVETNKSIILNKSPTEKVEARLQEDFNIPVSKIPIIMKKIDVEKINTKEEEDKKAQENLKTARDLLQQLRGKPRRRGANY
jgi:hypothetical protein